MGDVPTEDRCRLSLNGTLRGACWKVREPFGISKGAYWDFNSHGRGQPIDERRFIAAYKAELKHRAGLTKGRMVRSVFFGGGTPSLMKGETVGAVLDAIAALWKLAPD